MMREETKPKMIKPIISSRLPKAFTHPNRKDKKKNQEDMSAADEYRNLKKMLSPLKLNPTQKAKMKQALKQLEHFPQILNHQNSEPLLKLQDEVSVLPETQVTLQEMITLSVRSSSNRRCTIKKVLHAPTLKVYTIKQLPISTRDERKSFLDWIGKWQQIHKRKPFLVNVIATFWNSPEGCVSIGMQDMSLGSLSQIMENAGALPEKALANITKQVLTAVAYVHRKFGAHGGLTASQILFDRDFKVKLSLGLYQRCQPGVSLTVEQDMYDIGYTVLLASLGGIEWLEGTSTLKGGCCLLHNLERSIQTARFISRFSTEMKDFLCKCMNNDATRRPKPKSLLEHEWLQPKEYSGPDVSYEEMLGILQRFQVPTKEYWGVSENQLEKVCEALKIVLLGRIVTKPSVQNVEGLAMELGLDVDVVFNKIQDVFNEIC